MACTCHRQLMQTRQNWRGRSGQSSRILYERVHYHRQADSTRTLVSSQYTTQQRRSLLTRLPYAAWLKHVSHQLPILVAVMLKCISSCHHFDWHTGSTASEEPTHAAYTLTAAAAATCACLAPAAQQRAAHRAGLTTSLAHARSVCAPPSLADVGTLSEGLARLRILCLTDFGRMARLAVPA